MTIRFHRLAWVLVLLLVPSVAGADTITLDFERLPGPDGRLHTADDVLSGPGLVPLRDQFSGLGVSFSLGTLGQSSFFDGNPANHFITSTSPVGTFSVPIYGISIESYSSWTATLAAFDAHNALLGSYTLVNAAPGVRPLRGVLSVRSSVPIHHFSILPSSGDQILNLDNLVLQTTASPVPEPSTLVLACAGGLTALLRRRFGRYFR